MRIAKILTIIALTAGVVSLYSCTKEKEYTNGNGITIPPASDSVNPSLINASNSDIFFRVYNTETDYKANTNLVSSGMVLKGKQLSFKSTKSTTDSLRFIIEWFTADGSTSNWLNTDVARTFKFARNNGVQYFSIDNIAADSSHLIALGLSGDSSTWVTSTYLDATPNNDKVDTARIIKMYRNFKGKVTRITQTGGTFSTATDDVTYAVSANGKKVTITLSKDGAAYGTLTNNNFNLSNQVDTIYSSNRAKVTFAGSNRQFSMNRSN
ncbi:MAG: hypothetical protein R2800_02470 [Flavipsychrobacter sp.]